MTVPLRMFGLLGVVTPATGVPASTPTVTVLVAVLTPLVAVTTKVSVVDPVAARRCAAVGV